MMGTSWSSSMLPLSHGCLRRSDWKDCRDLVADDQVRLASAYWGAVGQAAAPLESSGTVTSVDHEGVVPGLC